MNRMIEVKQLKKKYGKRHVLKDISFQAHKGEITCLIGVNGVGKTTILKGIMNLTPLNGGMVEIDGKPLTSERYEDITFIPDTLTMMPSMTVKQSMDFMKDYYRSWNPKRAEDLLTFFKIKKEERISDLSKGNKAKVNMLLGLALDVDYLLMDEPFSGIDLFSREQILSVFSSHLVEDRGVLLTTHDLTDFETLVDKVVLIDDGQVVREFYTEEMRETEGKSVVDVMREVYQ